jgi:hypothetical protein
VSALHEFSSTPGPLSRWIGGDRDHERALHGRLQADQVVVTTQRITAESITLL